MRRDRLAMPSVRRVASSRPRNTRTGGIWMDPKKLVAEVLGTALLVIVAVGVATLSFGFKIAGRLDLGGCRRYRPGLRFRTARSRVHARPDLRRARQPRGHDRLPRLRRMAVREAIGYWIAQFVGGDRRRARPVGDLLGRSGLQHLDRRPRRRRLGQGIDGRHRRRQRVRYGGRAHLRCSCSSFSIATSRIGSPGFAGLAIGVGLMVVHLIGIPLTGTSVNPARSLGPAIIVGGEAINTCGCSSSRRSSADCFRHAPIDT